MNPLSCPRESDVRLAALTGRWTGALRAHAERCTHCADVALVTSTLAGAREARPLLPGDPGVLWMHARLNRRLHAEAQISRLVTAVHMVIGVVVLAGLTYVGSTLDLWRSVPPQAMEAAALTGFAALLLSGVVLVTRAMTRSGTRSPVSNISRR